MTNQTHNQNKDSTKNHTIRNFALVGFILGTPMGPAGSVFGLVTGMAVGAGVSTVKSMGSGVMHSGFFSRRETHVATASSTKQPLLNKI